MSKKLVSIILSVICLISLISCTDTENKEPPLPPATTVGLPKKEQISTNYETDGFVVNIYQTYSEIAEYKGKEQSVTVPDAFMGLPVKSIAEYAFFENATLSSITLPDPLLVIGAGAFQNCSALTEVVLGSRLEVISQSAFRDSALEKINLPDSIAEIARYAFYRTRLTEIKLPSNLSEVAKYSFYGCERLTAVEICPRIERIGEYAFAACTSLASAVVPSRTRMISDYAFSGCTSLEKIFVPKNTMVGENPFLSCDQLTVYSPSGSKMSSVANKYGYPHKSCASADKMP